MINIKVLLQPFLPLEGIVELAYSLTWCCNASLSVWGFIPFVILTNNHMTSISAISAIRAVLPSIELSKMKQIEDFMIFRILVIN